MNLNEIIRFKRLFASVLDLVLQLGFQSWHQANQLNVGINLYLQVLNENIPYVKGDTKREFFGKELAV